jgi:enoyl-CoA hydratase/carnithine racemase
MTDPTQRELAGGKLLLDEPTGEILRLTISNPEKRNALDQSMLDAIAATLTDLNSSENDVRCVIVTGARGMFSAGYEISDGSFMDEAERLVAHPFTEAIDAIEAFPYPTLAVLPGHTIGGGLELALACDMRMAAEKIKLGMPPAKLGLVYSHTGLRRFIDAIGVPRTRELFLLGNYIDAETALSWGLVNRVVSATELQQEALRLAGELAGNAPLSQIGNKRVIGALLRAHGALSTEVEDELIALRGASFQSRDLREGMSAFAEKRPPRWHGN